MAYTTPLQIPTVQYSGHMLVCDWLICMTGKGGGATMSANAKATQ